MRLPTTCTQCSCVPNQPVAAPIFGAATSCSALDQIRYCSGHIGIVDELKTAFTAASARRDVRGVFGISNEGLCLFCRWKRHNRDKRSVSRRAFQCLYIAAARQILTAMFMHDVVH